MIVTKSLKIKKYPVVFFFSHEFYGIQIFKGTYFTYHLGYTKIYSLGNGLLLRHVWIFSKPRLLLLQKFQLRTDLIIIHHRTQSGIPNIW